MIMHAHLVENYFRWLDKLGVAALLGHKRLFRQEFIGAAYGLLDHNQNPVPVSRKLIPHIAIIYVHVYVFKGLLALIAV